MGDRLGEWSLWSTQHSAEALRCISLIIGQVALSSFFNRLLALNQSESQLRNANETILKLENVNDWWFSLSSSDHLKAK